MQIFFLFLETRDHDRNFYLAYLICWYFDYSVHCLVHKMTSNTQDHPPFLPTNQREKEKKLFHTCSDKFIIQLRLTATLLSIDPLNFPCIDVNVNFYTNMKLRQKLRLVVSLVIYQCYLVHTNNASSKIISGVITKTLSLFMTQKTFIPQPYIFFTQ